MSVEFLRVDIHIIGLVRDKDGVPADMIDLGSIKAFPPTLDRLPEVIRATAAENARQAAEAFSEEQAGPDDEQDDDDIASREERGSG